MAADDIETIPFNHELPNPFPEFNEGGTYIDPELTGPKLHFRATSHSFVRVFSSSCF